MAKACLENYHSGSDRKGVWIIESGRFGIIPLASEKYLREHPNEEIEVPDDEFHIGYRAPNLEYYPNKWAAREIVIDKNGKLTQVFYTRPWDHRHFVDTIQVLNTDLEHIHLVREYKKGNKFNGDNRFIEYLHNDNNSGPIELIYDNRVIPEKIGLDWLHLGNPFEINQLNFSEFLRSHNYAVSILK